jgi:ATP-dependent helicase/nuclease subunit B
MSATGSGIFTIAPDRPFLDVLAKAVLEQGFPRARGGAPDPFDLARWTILVPTRRAARILEETFLRLSGKRGLLLPKIRPVGDIDEDLLSFDDGAEPGVPAAISRPAQQLLLMDLIDHWARQHPQTRLAQEVAAAPLQAQGLAQSLAEFLDSIETENVDTSKIPDLYDIENARHREAILEFLAVAREAYPARLKALGLLGTQQRRAVILHREATRLAESRSDAPFIAAGSTGTIEATRSLLKSIAGLPNGAVVLPGLDTGMDGASWQAMGPTHPQWAMKQLLSSLGLPRTNVLELGGATPSPRAWLASELMRPAETSHGWRKGLSGRGDDISQAMAGVELVETRSIPEEASAVALTLRHCLETPGRTACLITPDRQLARRVKAELARWNAEIDDSAGEPLIHAGGAAFLNLLLDALVDDFGLASLAALLHHNLCRFGFDGRTAGRAVSVIEVALLRAGLGPPDIAALAHALRQARGDTENRSLFLRAVSDTEWEMAISFAEQVSAALGPLRGMKDLSLAAHLDQLIAACEMIAGEAFWEGEAGELLQETLATLRDASPMLAQCDRQRAVGVVRYWLQSVPVRPPAGHGARLSILGLLEARLMRPDLVVLAGLNEGTWPGAPDPGPWLNRPMRDILGMSQPEREIGQTAHDFVQAFGAPEVKLAWARRSGDAPAIPSRWILRLQMIMRQSGIESESVSQWPEIARRMIDPSKVVPCTKPRPCPPVAARPRQLSVTRIETLIRDPYAIYARHILRLEPLEPVSAAPDPARRGIIFHGAIGDFLAQHPLAMPVTMETELLREGERHFEGLRDFPALTGFWWPRFKRIARWLVELEPQLRQNVDRVVAESKGALAFKVAGEPFTLTCRADRIDVLADGSARIIDYKTGSVPNGKQVQAGLAPQLTLQAAILDGGGFLEIGPKAVVEIAYIRLSGGEPAGEFKQPKLEDSVMDLARDHLAGLIRKLTAYASPQQPYLPRVAMAREDDASDYDHLSRYAEWMLSVEAP